MSIRILIAEPSESVRTKLSNSLAKDQFVATVYEATNEASFTYQLLRSPIDLIIINQRLIADITALPRGNLIILAAEPDIAILKKSYLHGACAYLSLQVATGLLQSLLRPSHPVFTLDPLFIPWAMEYLFRSPLAAIKEDLLTRREREIVGLLHQGYDRRMIANTLNISESTLKTHLKNIARKRETKLYTHLESQVLGGKQQVALLTSMR